MEEHPPRTGGGRNALGSTYIVEPSSTHIYSVILLHGLGSNGTKFGTELLETGIRSDGVSLPQLLPGAPFIFPTAKRRRSSAFRRTRLTQWFDVASLDDPSHRKDIQIQGLEESYLEIREILVQEIGKVAARNVILGGLSQGLAMGVISLLATEHPIGGFIGMSGWMPYREDIHGLVTGEGQGR
jgi:predicted esterase